MVSIAASDVSPCLSHLSSWGKPCASLTRRGTARRAVAQGVRSLIQIMRIDLDINQLAEENKTAPKHKLVNELVTRKIIDNPGPHALSGWSECVLSKAAATWAHNVVAGYIQSCVDSISDESPSSNRRLLL